MTLENLGRLSHTTLLDLTMTGNIQQKAKVKTSILESMLN